MDDRHDDGAPTPHRDDARRAAAAWFREPCATGCCADFEALEDERAGRLCDRAPGRFERKPWSAATAPGPAAAA